MKISRQHCTIALMDVFAAQLASTDMNDVDIQADRSSDGQKIIIAKERSELRIVCETPAAGASVKWTVNTFTTLSSGTERVEMTARNVTTVSGQPVTVHTLVIRPTSTMDIGTYECRRSDSQFDRVDVKIVRLASTLTAVCLSWNSTGSTPTRTRTSSRGASRECLRVVRSVCHNWQSAAVVLPVCQSRTRTRILADLSAHLSDTRDFPREESVRDARVYAFKRVHYTISYHVHVYKITR